MNAYHRHALVFRPEPQRPVCYRLHRTLLQRLRPLLLTLIGIGLVAALTLGVVSLVNRLYATQAQLDAAFLRGWEAAHTACEAR